MLITLIHDCGYSSIYLSPLQRTQALFKFSIFLLNLLITTFSLTLLIITFSLYTCWVLYFSQPLYLLTLSIFSIILSMKDQVWHMSYIMVWLYGHSVCWPKYIFLSSSVTVCLHHGHILLTLFSISLNLHLYMFCPHVGPYSWPAALALYLPCIHGIACLHVSSAIFWSGWLSPPWPLSGGTLVRSLC